MSRLEKIVGVEIIDDIRLGHTFHEVDVLEEIINKYEPKVFVEIGVHEGGLSYMLIPKLPQVYYIGVEIHCDLIRPVVKAMYTKSVHVQLLCMDCFVPMIHEFLDGTEGKMIYCDGGNKAKEMEHFKDICHPGDVILCHDYWDGTRKVRDVPDDNISKEVLKSDVQIYENDTSFERIPEEILKETRIIGWKKL